VWGDAGNWGNGYGYVGNDPWNRSDSHGRCGTVCAGGQCDFPEECLQLELRHCKCLKQIAERIQFNLQTASHYAEAFDLGIPDPHAYNKDRWGVDLDNIGGIGAGMDIGRGWCVDVLVSDGSDCDEILWHSVYHHEVEHACYAIRHGRLPPPPDSADFDWPPDQLAESETEAYEAEAQFLRDVLLRLSQCCFQHPRPVVSVPIKFVFGVKFDHMRTEDYVLSLPSLSDSLGDSDFADTWRSRRQP
jgi:hypothetical protein